jgi:hypothetical protein
MIWHALCIRENLGLSRRRHQSEAMMRAIWKEQPVIAGQEPRRDDMSPSVQGIGKPRTRTRGETPATPNRSLESRNRTMAIQVRTRESRKVARTPKDRRNRHPGPIPTCRTGQAPLVLSLASKLRQRLPRSENLSILPGTSPVPPPSHD